VHGEGLAPPRINNPHNLGCARLLSGSVHRTNFRHPCLVSAILDIHLAFFGKVPYLYFLKAFFMKEFGKKRLYKNLIIKILKNRALTIDALLNEINSLLIQEYGFEPISRRTFDRSKELLIKDGYQIVSRKINGRNYFVLEDSPENLNLTEDEKLTFPLLLGLLDTEKSMSSVNWLKTALMDDFDYSEKDLNVLPYFVHVQPTLHQQDQLLLLAGQIIDFAKRAQAIQFLYEKKGEVKMRLVAPLQVRYYDNRYYLLGSPIDEKTYELSNLLQTYTMDKFVEKAVYPAVNESEGIPENATSIYYDYAALYKVSKLEDLLKHSLGVWYDWKKNKLKTYRLKFTDWAMGIMENKKIHPSQVVIEKSKDHLIVELTVWNNPEIDYFVGRFGDKCERLN
jgi:hypothetical protein